MFLNNSGRVASTLKPINNQKAAALSKLIFSKILTVCGNECNFILS